MGTTKVRRRCARRAPSPAIPSTPRRGDYYDSHTDVSIATYGPALDFTRTYDASLAQSEAQSSSPGPLGYGWTDNWNVFLTITGQGVTVTEPTGAEIAYTPESGGSCAAPEVVAGTFCALPYVLATLSYYPATGTYVFVAPPHETYTFYSSGQLLSVSDQSGETTEVTYNSPSPGSGQCPSSAASCETITSPSGRALVVASNSAGKVTSVTDPLWRNWAYCQRSSNPAVFLSAVQVIQHPDVQVIPHFRGRGSTTRAP